MRLLDKQLTNLGCAAALILGLSNDIKPCKQELLSRVKPLHLHSACVVCLQVSTLDLCTPDSLGLKMLLICTAPSSQGSNDQDWVAAGLQLQSEGWPLQVLQVLPQGSDLQAAVGGSAHAAAQPLRHAVDAEGAWGQLLAGSGSAAVLVRPDGHIAWQSPTVSSSSSSHQAGSVGQQQHRGALERMLWDVLSLKPPQQK
jgi:hypothetical protein